MNGRQQNWRQRQQGRPRAASAPRETFRALPRGAQLQAEPLRPELDTTTLMQRPARQAIGYASVDRDTAPFPGEVILPTLYGLGIVPTEAPQMYRGSVFAGDIWGEPEE